MQTYRDAGRYLGHFTATHLWANDVDERDRELSELRSLAEAADLDGVACWYLREFPEWMELVPTDQLLIFADGAIEAARKRNFWAMMGGSTQPAEQEGG